MHKKEDRIVNIKLFCICQYSRRERNVLVCLSEMGQCGMWVKLVKPGADAFGGLVD